MHGAGKACERWKGEDAGLSKTPPAQQEAWTQAALRAQQGAGMARPGTLRLPGSRASCLFRSSSSASRCGRGWACLSSPVPAATC